MAVRNTTMPPFESNDGNGKENTFVCLMVRTIAKTDIKIYETQLSVFCARDREQFRTICAHDGMNVSIRMQNDGKEFKA